jgi:rhamnopyranosyl-N-acetylglucosaminyl-diphospho-decaprenol beta-1,3/1,4-galactofuranosyltransferase
MSLSNPSRPSVAAIVVTHNRPDHLRRVIDHLLGQPELVRAYVVNNAGSEATVRLLAGFAEHPRVCVLSLPENVGGAGGFHAGMKRALEDKDWDWVVLQDDDAWPEKDAFARLAATSGTHATSPYGVAALVHHPDGRVCEMNRPRRIPFASIGGFWHVLMRRGRMPLTDAEMKERARPIDMSSFVGLFLTRAAIEKTGLPEKRLFLYGDDWDYTLRMRKKGVTLLHDPGVVYLHDHQSRTGEREPFKELWKWFYSCRNNLIFMRTCFGPFARPIQKYWIAQWRKECLKYPDPKIARIILDRAARVVDHRDEWLPHPELLDWVKSLESPGGT